MLWETTLEPIYKKIMYLQLVISEHWQHILVTYSGTVHVSQ